jgi:hypothetical protein
VFVHDRALAPTELTPWTFTEAVTIALAHRHGDDTGWASVPEIANIAAVYHLGSKVGAVEAALMRMHALGLVQLKFTDGLRYYRLVRA